MLRLYNARHLPQAPPPWYNRWKCFLTSYFALGNLIDTDNMFNGPQYCRKPSKSTRFWLILAVWEAFSSILAHLGDHGPSSLCDKITTADSNSEIFDVLKSRAYVLSNEPKNNEIHNGSMILCAHKNLGVFLKKNAQVYRRSNLLL